MREDRRQETGRETKGKKPNFLFPTYATVPHFQKWTFCSKLQWFKKKKCNTSVKVQLQFQ